jgi:L-fuconolactonase
MDTTPDGSMPICDAHHHLWQVPGLEYEVADLRADIASTPFTVRSTIFVECSAWYRQDGPEHLRPVGETEWVVAHADDITKAIVGHADLRLGRDFEEALSAHITAGDGRFRGIRHRATYDPSPLIRRSTPDPGAHLLLDPDFRTGFTALSKAGLSFDAWMYFPQLPELVDLARAFTDTPIILDHLGGPITLGPYEGRRADVLTAWRPLIAQVATCPNVCIKLGGIGMPMYGLDWHKRPTRPPAGEVAAAWGDQVRQCIDLFGVDRCMFESNFPVDKVSMSYDTVWRAFDLITTGCSAAERDALFRGTAERIYRVTS